MSIKTIVDRNKSLIESFISLTLLRALTVLFPLLIIPYLFDVIGASRYGEYSFIHTVLYYVLIVNMYGFNYTATKQIAQNREDNLYINEVFNSVIYCRLFLIVVELIVCYILFLIFGISEANKILFIGGIGIIIGDALNPVWLFQGMEKMRYMTIIHFIFKSSYLFLIFLFINKESDYIYITIIDSIGYMLAGIISLFIAYKKFNVRFTWPKYNHMWYQYKESFVLFLSNISINLYKNANVFILNFFISKELLGLYAAAEKVVTGLQTLGTPISQALFPHFGKNFKGNTVKSNIKTLFKYSKYFAMVLIIITILGIVFSPFIIRVVCGSEYQDAVPMLRCMIPCVIFGGLNSLLGVGGLVNIDKKKYFFLGVWIAGISNILILLSFVSLLGVYAGVLSFLLSEVILFIVIICVLLKLANSDI